MHELLEAKRRMTLYGLACGDALGASIEFKQPGEFAPITTYRGGGHHRLAPGQFSDDCSMALALAESLKDGFDLELQIKEYVSWWKDGKYSVNGMCFDIGTTTEMALEKYVATGKISADCREGSSGNGSIMRLAPVPIKYYDLFSSDIKRLADLCGMSSVTTHGSFQCVSACRVLGVMLAALINGESRETVLEFPWDIGELDEKILNVVRGSYRSKARHIRGSGWVVESLEAALWAFHDASSFEEAVLRAVNLGNDADTTGAVCGQLAGAYWGRIPDHLMDGLDRKDLIESALSCIL